MNQALKKHKYKSKQSWALSGFLIQIFVGFSAHFSPFFFFYLSRREKFSSSDPFMPLMFAVYENLNLVGREWGGSFPL